MRYEKMLTGGATRKNCIVMLPVFASNINTYRKRSEMIPHSFLSVLVKKFLNTPPHPPPPCDKRVSRCSKNIDNKTLSTKKWNVMFGAARFQISDLMLAGRPSRYEAVNLQRLPDLAGIPRKSGNLPRRMKS